jgi:hypothetical protein
MDKLNDLEKKYSIPFPAGSPLQNNFLNNTTSWCRLNPIGCGRQAMTETFFLIMSYSAIIFLVGGSVPTVENLIKFSVIFLMMNIAARMVSDSFSDKLAIAALSGLGLKIVSTIAPKIIAW